MKNIRRFGKTYTTNFSPWGVNAPNGHRLLCSDGVIRAARLAQTADTFFSTPASMRIKGKTVTGYMTVTAKDDMSTDSEMATLCFRQHTYGPYSSMLPEWPSYESSEGAGVSEKYGNMRSKLNAILSKAH